MKKLLIALSIQTVVMFMVLFDADGMQVGTVIFENTPNAVIQIASVIGNLAWLMGIIYLIAGLALIAMSFSEEAQDKALDEAGDKRDKIFKFKLTTLMAIVISCFAVGSGFWFFGSMSLFMIVGYFIWIGVLKKRAPEFDKKNGIEPAKDITKSLLD